MLPKKLLQEIRKRKNKVFLVAAHIHLEGDALGSELAVASLLRRLGKKVIVCNEDAAPVEYSFLPGLDGIRHDQFPCDYDVALLVDCSDASRIGKVSKHLRKDRLLINIDHHISNTLFGDINWVESKASCASEMIYELFKALKVEVRKSEALLLYTGILVDTGSFKYSTTSPWTHRAASELLAKGLDVYDIYRRLNESMSFKTVKDLGRIIGTLKTDPSGKVAWLEVRHSLIKKNPVLAELTDQIINFARSVQGVEVALLFKEVLANREVRVNLRSRGRSDVNALAKIFGGGGHKMASGCTLRGNFRENVEKLVGEARKVVS